MIGYPWMSMFVGAVTPRQKTALAVGGSKAAANAVTARQLKRNLRIIRVLIDQCAEAYSLDCVSTISLSGRETGGRCRHADRSRPVSKWFLADPSGIVAAERRGG